MSMHGGKAWHQNAGCMCDSKDSNKHRDEPHHTSRVYAKPARRRRPPTYIAIQQQSQTLSSVAGHITRPCAAKRCTATRSAVQGAQRNPNDCAICVTNVSNHTTDTRVVCDGPTCRPCSQRSYTCSVPNHAAYRDQITRSNAPF